MRTLTSEYKEEVDIQRYAKVEKIPGWRIEDSTVLRGGRFNKDETHPKMKRKIQNANIVQFHGNYRFKGRKLFRRTAVQRWTHFGGSEIQVIRGEGNSVKVKYGARRSEGNWNTDVGKAAAGGLAKLPSTTNPGYKKVSDKKQWINSRLNVLVNLDDESVLRGTGVVQDKANSRKETMKAVPETQGMEVVQAPGLTANRDRGPAVPSKGLQQIKTVARAPLATALRGWKGRPPWLKRRRIWDKEERRKGHRG